jgi:hypothetical protein
VTNLDEPTQINLALNQIKDELEKIGGNVEQIGEGKETCP